MDYFAICGPANADGILTGSFVFDGALNAQVSGAPESNTVEMASYTFSLRPCRYRPPLGCIAAHQRLRIEGHTVNPAKRAMPPDFIETGISIIDIMNSLVRPVTPDEGRHRQRLHASGSSGSRQSVVRVLRV